MNIFFRGNVIPFIQTGALCSFNKRDANQSANPEDVGKSPQSDLNANFGVSGKAVDNTCWFLSIALLFPVSE